MVGPLREAIVEAARAGKLRPPGYAPTGEEFRAWLAHRFPDVTPEDIETARQELERAWRDAEDHGV